MWLHCCNYHRARIIMHFWAKEHKQYWWLKSDIVVLYDQKNTSIPQITQNKGQMITIRSFYFIYSIKLYYDTGEYQIFYSKKRNYMRLTILNNDLSFKQHKAHNAANFGLGGSTKQMSRKLSMEVYLYSGYNLEASRLFSVNS